MFDKIHQRLTPAVLAICLTVPGGATALPTAGVARDDMVAVGGCSLYAWASPAQETGGVYVSNDSTRTVRLGGGAWWNAGTADNGLSPLTGSYLLSCGVTGVGLLSQAGADAASYADEGEMYIRFRAEEDGMVYDYDASVYADGTVNASKTEVTETEPENDSAAEIAAMVQSRAGLVIASQPGLSPLLSGNAAGAFNVDATQGRGNFNIATSGNQPVWARIQGAWSEDGDRENSYVFGVAGAHYTITPDALVGVMLQFDKLTQENDDTTTEGEGYFVGPYFVAKLPDQPLYVEGSYLVGQTENSVRVDGAETQDFDTDRTLARVKVSGQLVYDHITLTPSLSAARLEDTQNAFTDNNSNAVAEQGVTVEDLAVGLDFAKPLHVETGQLLVTGGVSGIRSQISGSGFAETMTPDYEGQRARIHLGTRYTLDTGMVLSAGTNYDGIGVDDYESWGLDLGMEMKF